MNTYTTKAPTVIPVGATLKLTDEQARHRMRALEDLGKGLYRVKDRVSGRVMFKAGETIGIDGDIPKHLANLLDDGSKPKATKPKATKPKATKPKATKPKAEAKPEGEDAAQAKTEAEGDSEGGGGA